MDGATQGDGSDAPAETAEPRDEFERGLRFAHIMLTVNQSQGREAIAAVAALSELLVRKGVVEEAELDAARDSARDQLAAMPQPRVRLAEMGDKYAAGTAVEIDCASRIPLCQARCCTFAFYLTAQDLDEGVARWDYGNPYWIRQRADGYCVHCDPASRACGIHARRPHVCRTYDCRNDPRVWIDFDRRIPAPMPEPLAPMPIAMAHPQFSPIEDATGEPEADAGDDRA